MKKLAELKRIPISFREMVCEECGWSEATFYRKTRGTNTFSNAEKDKILAVADWLLKENLRMKRSNPPSKCIYSVRSFRLNFVTVSKHGGEVL